MTIRQFNMLSEFEHRRFTIDEALKFEQRTFGSLCRHQWINFDAFKNKFYITDGGYTEYILHSDHGRLRRMNYKRPFSMYVPKRVRIQKVA